MDKVIKNSANLINNFFEEVNSNIKHKGTKFILIIHPTKSSVYFPVFSNKVPEDKFIDYIYLKEKFKNYLNEEILILDLPDELIKEVKKNPNSNLFWKLDGHYNVEGYKLVSEIISNYLLSINNYHIKTEWKIIFRIFILVKKLPPTLALSFLLFTFILKDLILNL